MTAAPKCSVIIPTYNRRPILVKVLLSLAEQTADSGSFEVVVADDGSTDDTASALAELSPALPYALRVVDTSRPTATGARGPRNPAAARNVAIAAAAGEILVFLDSDMVVCQAFMAAHMGKHVRGDEVVHGPFIQTSNFDDPRAERRRWTDFSRAFFATGNSSVRKEWLVKAGLFDEDFTEYGWEDLEMGLRLRALGLRSVQASGAVGFHYKPQSHEYDLDDAIAREESRARMAAVFVRKHPTLEVRAMVLHLGLFYALEGLVSIGGWPDTPAVRRTLERLSSARGRTPLVLFLAKFVTGHAYAKELRRAMRAGELPNG